MASLPASSNDQSSLPSSSSEPAVTNSDKISVATSDNPSLADCVANSPLFKLPPELRNRIYGFVFGSSEAIKPNICCSSRAMWANQWDIEDYDQDEDFDGGYEDLTGLTSILSVCKIVKAEAIEVLYETKILRGWPIDLDFMLRRHDVSSRVRRIEIIGLMDLINSYSPYGKACHARHLGDMLERSQHLPRLCSILILSDCLTSNSRFTFDTWTSVMDFVREAKLEPATCVDVGRWQLHGKFKNVQIVNSKLVKMWPAVRGTPEDYNGVEDAMAIIEDLQSSMYVPNVATWASHTSLRCWVDLQKRFLALKLSGEWDRLQHQKLNGGFEDDQAEDQFKYEFFRRAADAAARVPIDNFPLLRSGGHSLSRLGPSDDSDLLNELSQFLAVNIAKYNHHSTRSAPRWELHPIVWKTEGDSVNKSGLRYMAEQQSIALSGGASKEFVLDPSLDLEIPACNLIERKVFMKWIQDFDHRDWTNGTYSSRATPSQTKQLTHLHLAAVQPFSLTTEDQHRRDAWSRGLLARYFLASGRLRRDAVQRASLGDLRTIMSTVLDVFEFDRYGEGHDWVKKFASTAALPPNFDDDVYPGLAWKYGELLAQAFKRYTSQGRVSKTMARQWVKEGTMWG